MGSTPVRFRRSVLGLLLGLIVSTLVLGSAMAADCEFILGFKDLRDVVGHEIVGECLENEHFSANGDGAQKTTGGLLVWRKADNHTAFTDGHNTWINGPNGLQKRLNSERFPWESDYATHSSNVSNVTQTETSAVLPLPPAPNYVQLTNHIDPQPAGNIKVEAKWFWLDGITTLRLSGDIPFEFTTLNRDGPDHQSTTITGFVCTPDKAEQEFQFDVAVSVLGDGERYQADWSPTHTLKHTVTCPKETPKPEPTPTPDPSFVPPAPKATISSRAANWQGKLVEIIMAVETSPEYFVTYSWRGGPVYSLFHIDGNIHYYHSYVCTAAEAGQTQDFWVSLSQDQFGQTHYADGVEPNYTELNLSIKCPTPDGPAPEATSTPTSPGPLPAPVPTPIPIDGALPLPPVPSVSVGYELIEAAYNLWSDDRQVILIKWDYAWPDGVARIETNGIASLTTWTAGQSPRFSTEVCWPSEAGLTARYSVSLRTLGDGVTYRAAWSDWSETVSVTVTCPDSPTVAATPTATPAPTPTPVPDQSALSLPPVPSVSISSELNEAAYNAWSNRQVIIISWDYAWPDGVAKLETNGIAGGTVWTAGQTPWKSTEVCWPYEAGTTWRYSVSVRTFGNGADYRAAWSDWSTPVSLTLTCPSSPNQPRPRPRLCRV